MKSKQHGRLISKAEISHVSKGAIWILVNNSEYMLSFKEFPWFKNATIDQIHNIETKSLTHLYWPELDVDVDIECVSNLHSYPLIYK